MKQRNWKKLPYTTIVLVLVNAVAFLVSRLDGGQLLSRGCLDAAAVAWRGEYGRILWSTFLHADFPHIFNNMVILFFLGSMIEQELGHIPYGMIYLLSGIGGSGVSLFVKLISGSTAVSVGASGAIFGLDGLLLAMVLTSRRNMPTVTPKRVLLMIALSLYSGYSGENIDNAGHVGGLVAGFLTGAIYCLIRKSSAQGPAGSKEEIGGQP